MLHPLAIYSSIRTRFTKKKCFPRLSRRYALFESLLVNMANLPATSKFAYILIYTRAVFLSASGQTCDQSARQNLVGIQIFSVGILN